MDDRRLGQRPDDGSTKTVQITEGNETLERAALPPSSVVHGPSPAAGLQPAIHPPSARDRVPAILSISSRALWVGAVAFMVGGVGQALLFSEERRSLGLALLGLGLVLGVVAW